MSAKYKAAIIGHTGQGDYGHGLDVVYVDMPDVEVVAVADPDLCILCGYCAAACPRFAIRVV